MRRLAKTNIISTKNHKFSFSYKKKVVCKINQIFNQKFVISTFYTKHNISVYNALLLLKYGFTRREIRSKEIFLGLIYITTFLTIINAAVWFIANIKYRFENKKDIIKRISNKTSIIYY